MVGKLETPRTRSAAFLVACASLAAPCGCYPWLGDCALTGCRDAGTPNDGGFPGDGGATIALVFRTQPSDTVAGAVIAPAVEVALVDRAGALVTAADKQSEVTLLSGGYGPLKGTTTVMSVDGVAVFADLSIERSGGYLLVATSADRGDVASAPFTISAGPASQLSVSSLASPLSAAAPFHCYVTASDAYSNWTTFPATEISVTLGANPAGGVLTSKLLPQTPGNPADFELSIDRAGTGYTLVAAAPGLVAGASVPFTVLASAWRPTGLISSSAGSTDVGPLVIDPTNPSVIYAATVGAGGDLYKSTDAGATWTRPAAGQSLGICGLAFGSGNPPVLFAATATRPMRSSDGGATWSELDVNVPPGLCLIAATRTVPATIYVGSQTGIGGIFASVDDGSTFIGAGWNFAWGTVTGLAVDPVDPRTAYASTASGGVLRTTDRGTTWIEVNTGLDHLTTRTMVADPVIPGALYVTSGEWAPVTSVYKTVNGGQLWTPASQGLVTALLWAMAIDPSNPSTIYAGGTWVNGAGVAKSHDGGTSWSTGAAGTWSPQAKGLAIDPTHPLTVYAATTQGVWKTTTGGE